MEKNENEPLTKTVHTEVVPGYKLCDLPIWFNEHNGQMQMVKFSESERHVTMQAFDDQNRLLGEVDIIKNDGPEETGWWVSWIICPWGIFDDNRCEFTGLVIFQKIDLIRAFGLAKRSAIGEFGHFMVETYGGDTADQGKYIRYCNYLNIPHPGTGLDGDPNISILLTDKIKKAIRKLLSL